MKIRIVDSSDNRSESMFRSVEKYNTLSKQECIFSSIRSSDGRLIDESSAKPELYLLHINDQYETIDFKKEPYCEYIQNIQNHSPNAITVLYSGGGIKVKSINANHINISQSDKTWDFDVKNSNNFIVIDHSVNSAADLNIAMTLENYAASNDQDAFINALRGANIPNHAIALAILCQGYFAAHAQDHEAMKEIIKIFDDEWLGAAYKKKVETESNDWWNIIETSEVRKKIPQDTDADLDNLLLLIAEGKNISDSHMVISSYKAISKAIGL